MAKKYETSAIMKAIIERCPGAQIVLLNVDDDGETADVAFTLKISPEPLPS